ncbi:quinon protein alcohol dehydrogenase-like superfamily [Penicillium angulare]|uniref:quinon protein alcohol dehydrogenase-like superfamily n=1 Tax=Penicillium angulare TaxID=116970 RepID=UPI0025406EA0|nr:quinon protein alcohol dehydrogenase-like superfamily [Penicillium angulare]KAJ5286606.1 quinon protein alcohol dehydrogenase-like superfamily [Penicillium angulare]
MSPVEKEWGSELQILDGLSGTVQSVVFSPDSKLLATTSLDDTLRVWNVFTGMPQYTVYGHFGLDSQVAFSPDGRNLVTVKDGSIQLLDAATGISQKAIHPKAKSDSMKSFSFSSGGQLMAISKLGPTLIILNMKTGSMKEIDHSFNNSVGYHKLSPDGRFIITSFPNFNCLSDATTGIILQTFKVVGSSVFSPDGQQLVFLAGRAIYIYEILTATLKYTHEEHAKSIRLAVFAPNSQLLAPASPDYTICLWNTATGVLHKKIQSNARALYKKFHDPSREVGRMTFSADGQLIASAFDDGNVRLWDANTGALRQTLAGHMPLTAIAFSPDSQMLALCASDGTVRLWGATVDASPRAHSIGSDSVASMAFYTDSRFLASGSKHGTMKLWDTTVGTLKKTYRAGTHWVDTIALSPDGHFLASADFSRVRIWDSTTEVVKITLCCENRICSMAFSYDGKLLAVATYHNLQSIVGELRGDRCRGIKIYDTASGKLRQTVGGPSLARERGAATNKYRGQVVVAFSPDGHSLTSVSQDRIVRVWNVAMGALQEEYPYHSCLGIDYLTTSKILFERQISSNTFRASHQIPPTGILI